MALVNKIELMASINAHLSGDQLEEAKQVISRIIKKDGTLRASKPKGESAIDELSKYVWRMVAFVCIPSQCSMPVMAEFDFYNYISKSKPELESTHLGVVTYGGKKDTPEAKLAKFLEDSICNAISKDQWHNVRTWAKALSYS